MNDTYERDAWRPIHYALVLGGVAACGGFWGGVALWLTSL